MAVPNGSAINGQTILSDRSLVGSKRKRDTTEAELDTDQISKRTKVMDAHPNDDVVVLDDEETGAIVIDD